ncbi:MAG: hypothetical protein H0W40_03580 [Methylibium sp.]|uniref:hypothetical protein n=1 Tax=Methylibium sp. TaxID=2067992 RepID=UPI00184D46AA|nr:hypothetical protein [Methylibium sp.]MBA3596443.1 hypothetical protein [Methylibium sp.]
MAIFLFWLTCSIAVGVIADGMRRSGYGWCLLALFISPFIAGILVLVLGPPKGDRSSSGMRVKGELR